MFTILTLEINTNNQSVIVDVATNVYMRTTYI